MIDHIWSVLCERISVDQQSNLQSYLTCIEDITVQQLPARILRISFASRWFKKSDSKNNFSFRLSLVHPGGTEEVLIKYNDMKFDPKFENIHLNFILDNLLIKEEGLHTFRLERKRDNDWQMVSKTPLKVQLIPANKTKGTKKGSKKG